MPTNHTLLEVDRLIERIAEILERGGSCLIPVFALGRMQEMLKILFEARKFGRLPRCRNLRRKVSPAQQPA